MGSFHPGIWLRLMSTPLTPAALKSVSALTRLDCIKSSSVTQLKMWDMITAKALYFGL